MKTKYTMLVPALALMAGLTSCVTTPEAKLDDKTASVLDGMSDKLAGAKTLSVNVKRTASPDFFAGTNIAESTSGTVLVQRPDKLAARMQSGNAPRSMALNGNTLTLVDHAAQTHAVVDAPGDIDTAVRSIYETFGFMPPVAELLVNDPKALMLEGVRQATYVGTQSIGGVECDRLAFQQDGLSWQLWVATSDSLPRRIVQTYPTVEGGKPLNISADFSNWKLNPALKESDFVVKIPSGSQAIEMIPIMN